MAKQEAKMIVANGIRYRQQDARRLGLIKDGKVITARSKNVTPLTTAQPGQITIPKRNATKADWIVYAVTHGTKAADLEGMKRDEIADLFLEALDLEAEAAAGVDDDDDNDDSDNDNDNDNDNDDSEAALEGDDAAAEK